MPNWHHTESGPICPCCQTPLVNVVDPQGQLVEGRFVLCSMCSTWLIIANQELRLAVAQDLANADDDSRKRMHEMEDLVHTIQQRMFH